ncbi:MAG TPA: DUF115 domain-containing protein, partial [bacterium]|nr:DUF115 domain-containing protein [bacterium]
MLRLIDRAGARELQDDSGRSIHSRYQPTIEGERQAAALQVQAETLLFVVGPGLGYMLPPLAARGDCRVVAVEQPAFLPTLPAGVGLLPPGHDPVVLADWQASRYRFIRVVRGPAYRHDPRYAAAERQVQEAIERWAAEQVTCSAFGALWLENFAAQAALNPTLAAWQPRASGATAVIVAAGPSLNDAGPALRSFAGPIWAVDTAWPVLRRLGRLPELVVSNDPQAVSQKHFAGGPDGDGSMTTLLTTLTADPGVARWFARRRYYDDDYPLNSFFPEIGRLPAFSHAGGSAVMILYQLAAACGAKRVIMIGQDLAYPSAGASHAAGTLYGREALQQVQRFATLETSERRRHKHGARVVRGVSGMVTVTPPMEQYRLWLERFIAAHPDIVFENTATHGVAIAGARAADATAALANADGLMLLPMADEQKVDWPAGVRKIAALHELNAPELPE